MDIDVRPQPRAIEKISPTSLNRLLECPKRVAYARDDRTRGWQRPTTRTALGLVSHALTEAVERSMAGQPADEDPERWLQSTWDDLVADQQSQLEQAWPGRLVPPASSWPGYAVTKVRLIRSLARRVRRQAVPAAKPPAAAGGLLDNAAGEGPRLPWVERRLDDAENRLFGTPDRVEEVGSRLRVVDLKSGVAQGDISPAQERQLLIYAWLVQRTLGRAPDDIVVLDVTGRERTIAVNQSAVGTLVALTAATVAQFNDSLVATAGAEARPAPEVCSWCEFRVVCGDYWATRNSDWPKSGDLAGVVVDATTSYVALRLLDNDRPHRLLLTEPDHANVGDVIVAVDLESAGFETSRLRWNSRLRVLSGGDRARLDDQNGP